MLQKTTVAIGITLSVILLTLSNINTKSVNYSTPKANNNPTVQESELEVANLISINQNSGIKDIDITNAARSVRYTKRIYKKPVVKKPTKKVIKTTKKSKVVKPKIKKQAKTEDCNTVLHANPNSIQAFVVKYNICTVFGSDGDTALKIAYFESGFNTTSVSKNRKYYGVFQIDCKIHRKKFSGGCKTLHDLMTNINVARQIFIGRGRNWSAWSTSKLL